ncbi:NUDIX hydrolase [Aestuariivita sp.]|jgi:8-oxo-dGTP diphosphatase|uniref:NUDIX hydrolase n=1 Tax=Aestuariivita sp. TaxID=1872407 RepID=UPI00216C65FB|nr:NUDIX hydrolase [Aestuariivita sp.]MCE8005492.1 NUDIX hydrolase [Aestuariivita sp.]
MIRRFGSAPQKGQRYILRPGAYAVLPRNGALLLTVQIADPPDIQLPGGGIDPGETPLCALHREVYEETGWHIARPRRLGAFRRFVFMPEYDLWAEKLCHIYLAHPTRQLGPPLEADHEVLWATPDTATRVLGNAGDRHFARQFGA